MLHILSDDFCAFPFGSAIEKAVNERRSCILLVPEQMALATERAFAARLPAFAPLYFEVSNFSRLADRVFRSEGGISYQYADHAAEIILMWKTLDATLPLLNAPKKGAADTVKEELAALAEITAAGIRPNELMAAARELSEKPALSAKLSDLATLTEIYEGERDMIYGSLATDLDKLLAILEKKPVFKDTEIYVSGFTSFTARELAVLTALMRHGELSVSLPLPEKEGKMLSYGEVLATYEALMDAAEGKADTSRFTATDRPPMLEYVKKMLFRADGDTTPYAQENDGALSLALTRDPYAGAALVASEIAASVRAGARYRDFTVITRAPEKYDGILDDALLSEGIPYFFSKQTDITELALSKMILAAYACIDRGFSRADLLAYLKCGFSGIARDDGDLFEMYAERWNLKGAAFTDLHTPYDMHPKGYEADFSDGERETLERINRVREHLVSPLLALKQKTDGEKTAREHATALYELLIFLDVPRLLKERAAEETAAHRTAEAARLSRLFSVLCDLLDRIVKILDDSAFTRSRFLELLTLLFSSVSLDTIPTLSDAVTVCNADTFRPSGETTVILFGAVEGEFPAAVGLGGVFPEEERRLLAEHKVKVGKPPEVKASREQFSFLRGLLSAKRALVISFESDALGAALRPSPPYISLKKLFPNAMYTQKEDAFTLQAAAERLFEKRGSAEGEAIAQLLAEDPAYVRVTEASALPLFDPSVTVSEKNAKALFPDKMTVSQSRIEDYLDCPFAYYCKRALHLDQDERISIRPLEVGNIIHAILEKFFLYLGEDKTDIRRMDRTRIPAYVERAIFEYTALTFPKTVQASPRFTHLLARMRRAAITVCEDLYDEFSVSAFTPTFCELKLDDENGPGTLVFKDEDGKTVSIGGRIDRVDTFQSESGELFVRVVDYKTSTHTFSRDKVKKARDLQMFLYLCAIWKTQSAEFLKKLSPDAKEGPLPAGIVYNTANPKAASLSYPVSDGVLSAKIQKELLNREGFFLAEEEVLRAMDDRLPHMAYAANKDGEYKTDNKKLFGSLVEFGELLDDAERAVLGVARRMREGHADIAPDRENERCADCTFRTVCRNEDFKTKAY